MRNEQEVMLRVQALEAGIEETILEIKTRTQEQGEFFNANEHNFILRRLLGALGALRWAQGWTEEQVQTALEGIMARAGYN